MRPFCPEPGPPESSVSDSRKKSSSYPAAPVWNSGNMERELGFDDEGRPVLITRAAYSYEEQHRARVRKYLKLMFWRIPAFIAAAVAYSIWHNGLLSLAILAVSIPLPWMAVLIANDRPPRTAEEPRRFPDAPQRTALFPRAEQPALEARIPSAAQPQAAHSGEEHPR